MIKYCYDKWNRNKEKLRNWLKNTEGLNSCVYEDLMKAVVTYILNDEIDNDWDAKNITVIDDFMNLCKDLVCNIVKPYNNGWRHSSEFDTVEF